MPTEEELAAYRIFDSRGLRVLKNEKREEKGGPGSGDWGHDGRPGEVGGSGGGAGALQSPQSPSIGGLGGMTRGIPKFADVGEAARWAEDNIRSVWYDAYTTAAEFKSQGSLNDHEKWMNNIRAYLGAIKEIEKQHEGHMPSFTFNQQECNKIGAGAFYQPVTDRITLGYQRVTTGKKELGGSRDLIDRALKEGFRPYVSSLTPRGIYYHEYAHSVNTHARGMSRHDDIIRGLSPDDKKSIRMVSEYTGAAIDRTGLGRNKAPRLEEAYSESVGAIVDGNPSAKYIPDSVKESIYNEMPWLKE